MYSVIGTDGLVYGPVDLGQLQLWVNEGRVTPTTVLIDDVTGQRAPASTFPLVQSMFPVYGAQAPSVPRYATPASPYPTTQIGQPQQRSGYGSYPVYPSGDLYASVPPKSKVIAAMLAILLGCFGAHQFYLGKVGLGIAMLLITIATCGIGSLVTLVWSLVDFAMILGGSTVDSQGRPLA